MKPRALLYLCAVFVTPSALALCQNAAVRWATIDMGFGSNSFGNTRVISVAGQNVINSSAVGNSMIGSGFAANPSLRGVVVAVREHIGVPNEYALSQNFPNPFNPTTTIRYELAGRINVSLIVYNMLGQEVATLVSQEQEAGFHEVKFDAVALASGVYFYRLSAGDFVSTRKLVVLR